VKINARLLVRLYPRAWRERYGAELSALLDELPAQGARVAFDLAVGALREQLRAAFVDVPERRRQAILANFVTLGSWAGGTVSAVLIVLALPDFVKDDDSRAMIAFAGTMASLGTMLYLLWLRKMSEPGSTGVPRLTLTSAVLFAMAGVVTAVIANLQIAHQYHLGRQTLADVWIGAAARSLPFVLIGMGIAGILWPELFRRVDPTAPGQSSDLGLGA
jgi:hypothetical protein